MKTNIDYFGIYFFFSVGITFFFIMPSIIIPMDGNAYATIIAIMGILFFLIGSTHTKRFHIGYIKLPTSCNYIAISICLYYCFSIVSFLLSTVEVSSYTEKYLNVNYIEIYKNIFQVLLEFIKYYILAAFVGTSKRKYYIVFALSFLANLHSDTRLNLVLPAIFWCGYGYYFGIIKITIFRVISILACTPIIFTFLLLKRVMKGTYSSYIEQMKYIYDYLSQETLFENIYVSMESFRSYELYIHIIQDGFIHIESGFLRIVFMFIPRSFWADKPESVSRIISHNYFPEQYYGGGGTVANIFGDAYINGGILGVIIIMLFWGGITRLIYNTTIKRLNSVKSDTSTSTFLVTFYLLYLLESIQYFRGFMSESFWKLLYLIFITLFISRAFRKNV